jgi:type IV fimbrial biogenesis protein FimT
MRGITLIELLVTLAIIAILIALVTPSFETVIHKNRIAATANLLNSSLQLARSEAITRGLRVTICKSASVDQAQPVCSQAANWQDGWLAFANQGHDCTVDAGDELLKVFQPASDQVTITATSSFDSCLSYLPDGTSEGTSFTNGSFSMCLNAGAGGRTLIISNTGRIRLDDITCP